MTKHRLGVQASLLAIAVLGFQEGQRLAAADHDWPQWRGARRNARSTETGLLKEWPKKGPPLAWKASGLGAGYSEVSVAAGRIFTMGERRDPKKRNFKTGKVMWREGRPGKGSIAYADGRLYYRNEGGPITLVEANPKKYVERGRFEQPQRGSGPTWAHPVIANGKLYLRHADLLFCYNVKEP
jgi:hypothetical protein